MPGRFIGAPGYRMSIRTLADIWIHAAAGAVVCALKQRPPEFKLSSRVDPTPCGYPASFTPRGMVGDSRRCSWGRS